MNRTKIVRLCMTRDRRYIAPAFGMGKSCLERDPWKVTRGHPLLFSASTRRGVTKDDLHGDDSFDRSRKSEIGDRPLPEIRLDAAEKRREAAPKVQDGTSMVPRSESGPRAANIT